MPLALSSITIAALASFASSPEKPPLRQLCCDLFNLAVVLEVRDGVLPEKFAPEIGEPVKTMVAASLTCMGAASDDGA